MESRKPVWIGYSRTGGRFYLKPDEMHPGVNVIGTGSNVLATSIASACDEVGLNSLVLDFGGRVSEQLSGHVGVRGFGYFLYDSMRMEQRASLHAELAASAYTMALNLSFEQEGFLNSAIQLLGLEQGVASPASLSDRLNERGEYRGHTADELKGKLGALRSLNVTGETGVIEKMMARSTVASFAGSESHQTAEVALMLFLAKVLALGESGVRLPDVLVVTEANRVFANLPLTRHSNRLLTALLSSEMARIFASEGTYGLDHHLLDIAPVRILSSSIWNDIVGGRASIGGLYAPQHAAGRRNAATQAIILTPNLFMLQDSALGFEEAFVPRGISQLTAQEVEEEAPRADDTHLTKQILELVSSYDAPTRGSVIAYLTSENPQTDIEKTVDRLLSEGCLTTTGKDAKRDSPLSSVNLTPKGYDLMRRLK